MVDFRLSNPVSLPQYLATWSVARLKLNTFVSLKGSKIKVQGENFTSRKENESRHAEYHSGEQGNALGLSPSSAID